MEISIISQNTAFFKPGVSVIFNSSFIPRCSSGQCTGIQRGDCPQSSVGAGDGLKTSLADKWAAVTWQEQEQRKAGCVAMEEMSRLFWHKQIASKRERALRESREGCSMGLFLGTKRKCVAEKQSCSVLWRGGQHLFLLGLFVVGF